MKSCPCGTNRINNFRVIEFHNDADSLVHCKKCGSVFFVKPKDTATILNKSERHL